MLRGARLDRIECFLYNVWCFSFISLLEGKEEEKRNEKI